MGDCVFCDILAGAMPSSQVYHDEICTALMDIQPINPGHLMVIPNQHAANLSELDEDGRAAVRAESVGFVFQSFHLVPSLNALENVMLPLELAGGDNARDASRKIIEKVGLSDRWSHYPAQLSGGEKQRVAIARAFATEPAVLFADEPTGNLDSRTGSNIMELMFELNRSSSTTLVLVTHDLSLAERCDRVLSLDAGRLVSDTRGSA